MGICWKINFHASVFACRLFCAVCLVQLVCTLLFQLPIEEKIEIIAKKIYGADGIELEPLAKEQVERYKRQV